MTSDSSPRLLHGSTTKPAGPLIQIQPDRRQVRPVRGWKLLESGFIIHSTAHQNVMYMIMEPLCPDDKAKSDGELAGTAAIYKARVIII